MNAGEDFKYAKIVLQFTILNLSFIIFVACSPQRQISKSAANFVLKDSALLLAHVGISIFDPAANKYLYNFQGDKYFVPASNTKIPTCYAAMKYLGDSLAGLRYAIPEEKGWENALVIRPTGDPTFLHEEYNYQPVIDFFSSKFSNKKLKPAILFDQSNIDRWGSGWSWNDYEAAYMAERNVFPGYGNVINITLNDSVKRIYLDTLLAPGKMIIGKIFKTQNSFFDSLVNLFSGGVSVENAKTGKTRISRDIANNDFRIRNSGAIFSKTSIPFVTHESRTTIQILENMYGTKFSLVTPSDRKNKYLWERDNYEIGLMTINKWQTIRTQPTDSLLKPMMHRSDNFFAEQSLLMVSNELLGVMNDEKVIDTLLKTDFKDLPQRPRWADGSGLSRYNLFTPQDFVAILNKMKNEFGMERIKNIFPTGNEGTLSNYYKADSSYIFAKTGSLSGVIAFSGFLFTKKNKLLIFSVLVNNHRASGAVVRRAVEKFVQGIRERY